MALILTEAAKLSNDLVVAGVIETIVKDNPLLERLPFIEVVGNALTYNRESTMGSANFYDVGDTWVEDTPTYTQATASLKICGGDADVDQFIQQTRSNINDQEATAIELKAKAVRHTFEERFFYGSNTTNPKEFDGLHVLVGPTTGQTINQGSGTTGAALSLINLDAAIDLVKPGKPDIIVMTREVRRRITQHTRASGFHFEVSKDEMGRQVELYNDTPMVISDHLVQTETLVSGDYALKTTGACSTIFVMRFGESGLAGLTNGWIQVERLGTLETKDARRTRIKFYCGLALFSALALAAIDGVTNAAVTDA